MMRDDDANGELKSPINGVGEHAVDPEERRDRKGFHGETHASSLVSNGLFAMERNFCGGVKKERASALSMTTVGEGCAKK